MLDARFMPIEQWPGTPIHAPKRATFRCTYARTQNDLEHELRRLKARDVVIQVYVDADQIRQDGYMRASATPRMPGVILSFTGTAGAVSFPCDTYTHWQDNLRAIALALAALRAVDRYGVTRNSEQYRGWAKLPPVPAQMTVPDALAFVALHAGMPAGGGSAGFKTAYRRAAGKLHPDNPQTGNHAQFVLLQKAEHAVKDAYGW